MSKGFKSTYLRLLHGAAPVQADYWAARELIDNGYAHGHYQVSKSHLAYGEVTAMVGFAPTMNGRLYADELAEEERRRTLRYRLAKIALGGLTFGAGWVAGVLSRVSEAALLNWLGLGG